MEDKLESWEEKSKDLIGGFMGLFGRDGRIVSCIVLCAEVIASTVGIHTCSQ